MRLFPGGGGGCIKKEGGGGGGVIGWMCPLMWLVRSIVQVGRAARRSLLNARRALLNVCRALLNLSLFRFITLFSVARLVCGTGRDARAACWSDIRHTYQGVTSMSSICLWHSWFTCVTWLKYDISFVHMWQGLVHLRVTCLIHTWHMTHLPARDMPHSYLTHDSFIYAWHASFTPDTWLIYLRVTCLIHTWHMTHLSTRDMPHSYVTHHTFIFHTWRIDLCDTWFSHMWRMTHPYVIHHTFICDTSQASLRCTPLHVCVM